MAGNSFGQLFRITTFGESHGEAIGVIIDGCPAQLDVDLEYIQSELDKRRRECLKEKLPGRLLPC
jgi:chorismate synthase